jgi:4-hydroxy 2-oxovalerate aldolase
MESIAGLKVLDATLRDGGLVNDFYFSDEFVRNVYKANIAFGVSINMTINCNKRYW